jgi:outer membrane lipoprotein-sorting protein
LTPVRGARLAAMVSVCAFGAAVTVAAPGFDLAQLMAMLAQVGQSEVAFEETRHLALLSKPIVRRGTLHYVKPDRLEMRVVSPSQETIQIAGSSVRVESADGTREWDLTLQPVALAWIEGIRASLAGDTATLTRQFRVALKGSSAEWELRLEPRAASVAAALSRIDVRGRETQLTSIEILDAQGDRISIAIAPKGKSSP